MLELKEMQICIWRTVLVWSFYSTWIYTSLYFLPILLRNQFFFLSFCAFCVFCSEFDAIFMNFCNICIIMIYIVGVRYSVFLLSLVTFQLNNLWEQMHVIKTWLQLLTKKHASRVLLGFKNSIHEEKCKIFTNERK